jgi:hypothetical protein
MDRNSSKNMFLTPQELRIGNYINYENTTHIVTELHKEKIIHHWLNYADEGYVTSYSQILSIPLSVREIESLGFLPGVDDRYDNRYFYDNKGYVIDHNNDTFWFCRAKGEHHLDKIAEVDFVHQFQNLYFDITRRELRFSN